MNMFVYHRLFSLRLQSFLTLSITDIKLTCFIPSDYRTRARDCVAIVDGRLYYGNECATPKADAKFSARFSSMRMVASDDVV